MAKPSRAAPAAVWDQGAFLTDPDAPLNQLLT